MTKKIALYPGSFDPITLGHIDIARRACQVVDKLVLAVGVHHGKKPFFTAQERFDLIGEVIGPIASETGTELDVISFDGLVVDAARKTNATLMIRGLRDGTDLDYEMQLAGMNEAMAPDIFTLYLPSSGEVRHIAASLVRQVATMGGDITPFVPPAVNAAVAQKLST
ncbi:MAG: pantetheine-phosphate adenylyltransferase [Cohaesibacter sp.]|jgi:pantetheine-phosphate adenylyltransferase|nr:pantetheine-phosphate adenylyltransferase [Cohaesibacter sp.]